MLEHLRHAAFDRLLDAAFAVVDDLRQHPHHAQRNHHAHVGRQVGDALEYGYEQQAEDARDEDELAQPRTHALGQLRFERAFVHGGRVFVAHVAHRDRRRDDYRYDARHEKRSHQGRRSDVAAHPEHDRRHVADGRPCAAAVGRDDDQAGENPALLLIRNDSPQQHYHDDRRGHVVQRRRHEKRDDGQQPHQLVLVASGNVVGDDVEAAVRVDQIDDGHGSDQENQDFARVAQMVYHLVADVAVVSPQAENRPYRAAHKQCDGRFVHFYLMLQRDERVTHHEEQNHCQNHALCVKNHILRRGRP